MSKILEVVNLCPSLASIPLFPASRKRGRRFICLRAETINENRGEREGCTKGEKPSLYSGRIAPRKRKEKNGKICTPSSRIWETEVYSEGEFFCVSATKTKERRRRNFLFDRVSEKC